MLVLVTNFPVRTLLSQRHQLTTTSAQVAALRADNRALSAEAAHLASGPTIDGLARSDFGFVQPGQKAYTVLPTAGSSPSSAALSGHVPLSGPPVVPGSTRSQALLGGAAVAAAGVAAAGPAGAATGFGPAPAGGSTGATQAVPGTSSAHSFWQRVVSTFEFWR